ncbi:unnamed protein product [Caenorhabditis sp. 36 PRJEB53466]|nr:unnamed protein product [Caenorhabditis sp. 36 PRJEB53466]
MEPTRTGENDDAVGERSSHDSHALCGALLLRDHSLSEYDYRIRRQSLKELLPIEIADVRRELSNFFMCCHPIFSFADYMIFSLSYRKTVVSLFARHQSVSV